MTANLMVYGQMLRTTLAVTAGQLQNRSDGLLKAENIPAAQPEKSSGLPVWAIVIIVIVAILCLLPICIIAILTLLGPTIGNVFSNIIDTI